MANMKRSKSTHRVYKDRRFEKFQEKINIQFSNEALLIQAFTHSSYVNEHRKKHYKIMNGLNF